MKELIAKIQDAYAAFEADANAQVEKGNKAAGTRARKASLEIEKMMKEFRKASLEASKNWLPLLWPHKQAWREWKLPWAAFIFLS